MTDRAGIPAVLDAIGHMQGVEAGHDAAVHVREERNETADGLVAPDTPS